MAPPGAQAWCFLEELKQLLTPALAVAEAPPVSVAPLLWCADVQLLLLLPALGVFLVAVRFPYNATVAVSCCCVHDRIRS